MLRSKVLVAVLLICSPALAEEKAPAEPALAAATKAEPAKAEAAKEPAKAEAAKEPAKEAAKEAAKEPAKAWKPPRKLKSGEVDQTVVESYIEAIFPKKVLEPAILQTLGRLIPDAETGKEKAKQALESALYQQSGVVRNLLGDVAEALVAQDRKAYDGAMGKLTEALTSRSGYWDKAVQYLFQEMRSRAEPVAKVAVSRHYECDQEFLGLALGYDTVPKKAGKKAGKVAKPVRRLLCDVVRRWSEKRVVTWVDDTIKAMSQYLLTNERKNLAEGFEEVARDISRTLERMMLSYVGNYQVGMMRIKRALELVAQNTLPASPPPAAPAPTGEQPAAAQPSP